MWARSMSPTFEFGFGNIGSFNSSTMSPRFSTHRNSLGRIPSLNIEPTVEITAPDVNKKTLVLDLDETLIHSSDFPPHSDILYFKSGEPEFFVHKRPGLDKFLDFVRENFEIFIFTFGDKNYAEPVLDTICPFIDNEHRFYRDSCETKQGRVKKDLSIFKRDKKNIILIDDSNNATTYNPNNTIRISRWKGSPQDDALINWLPPILNECLIAEDVRKVIHKAQDNQNMKRRNSSYFS